jgi:hypothetical protein
VSAPAIPFSEREVARKAYWHVVCMGRGNLLGVDMDQVQEARLQTVLGAQRAVERAIAGPPRCIYSEPDDDTLERMRAYLETRRAELERR